MAAERRSATPCGEVILDRLEALSLSIAEIERRTPLTKNTISNAIYGPRQPQRKTIEILAEALELPVEVLTRAGRSTPPPAPSSSFGAWLFRAGNPGLWISLAGTAGALLVLSRGLGPATSPAPGPPALLHGLHFLVILLLLARLPRVGVRPETRAVGRPSLRLALAAAADFRRYWGAAWLAWLFLYLGLTAAALTGLLPSPELPRSTAVRAVVVGLNLVQNGATVMLLMGYEVLARPTIEADLSRKQVLPKEAWLALALLLPLLEGGVLLAGLAWELQQWFGWLSGFAQGTALALVVGRLDSKYIEPPALLVALLYIYAAIQGAWPVLQSEHALMLVLAFLAMVLKCLLFLAIAWLFESRVLVFYLERVRQLDQGVRREREEFLEQLR